MKPLEIHVRNRIVYAKIIVDQKFEKSADYTLFDKNGVSIYIFRQEINKWSHVYGKMAEDVREACIDALILRFDRDCTDMFYHKGERKVIDVSFAHGADHWAIYVNRRWVGTIRLNESPIGLVYNEHNNCEALTADRIEKYFQWIREGKIKGGRIKNVDRDGK